MVERTIKIDDDLEDREETVKEEILDAIKDYLNDNPDAEDFDSIDGSERIHEIIDSNVPIYHYNINGLWYLYSDQFEEAYNNSGCYNELPENYKQVCIFFYLEEIGRDYLREKEEEFKGLKDDWESEESNEDKEPEEFIKHLDKDTDYFKDFEGVKE